MSGIDYDDDFPEEFDLQHENAEPINPYLTMSNDDFRLHVIGLLDQMSQNQVFLKEAMENTFEEVDKKLLKITSIVQTFQKRAYGETH